MSLVHNIKEHVREIRDYFYNPDPQNPVPSNGDSVYEKDIWIEESNSTGWNGDVVSLFNNLHSSFDYIGVTNPKTLLIHFKRTVVSNAIGLGCTGGGDFSNVKIEIVNSGSVATTVIDESGDNTKHTSKTYPLPITAGFNAVRFTFTTTNDICLTNCVILKSTSQIARLQAAKPDNTVTDINATNAGNLKVSMEEIETQISDDSNQRLMVAPYLIDEFDNVARLLSDNLFLGAPVMVASEHHEIHCGDSYEATDNYSIPNSGTRDYLITVPNETGSGQSQKLYHFLKIIESTSELEAVLYEVTDSSGGMSIQSYNRNRNSALSDVLTITHSPTVTTLGNPIWGPWRIGVGRTGESSLSRSRELILKNNTKYLLRLVNQETTVNNINVEFDYYVHPGV